MGSGRGFSRGGLCQAGDEGCCGSRMSLAEQCVERALSRGSDSFCSTRLHTAPRPGEGQSKEEAGEEAAGSPAGPGGAVDGGCSSDDAAGWGKGCKCCGARRPHDERSRRPTQLLVAVTAVARPGRNEASRILHGKRSFSALLRRQHTRSRDCCVARRALQAAEEKERQLRLQKQMVCGGRARSRCGESA